MLWGSNAPMVHAMMSGIEFPSNSLCTKLSSKVACRSNRKPFDVGLLQTTFTTLSKKSVMPLALSFRPAPDISRANMPAILMNRSSDILAGSIANSFVNSGVSIHLFRLQTNPSILNSASTMSSIRLCRSMNNRSSRPLTWSLRARMRNAFTVGSGLLGSRFISATTHPFSASMSSGSFRLPPCADQSAGKLYFSTNPFSFAVSVNWRKSSISAEVAAGFAAGFAAGVAAGFAAGGWGPKWVKSSVEPDIGMVPTI